MHSATLRINRKKNQSNLTHLMLSDGILNKPLLYSQQPCFKCVVLLNLAHRARHRVRTPAIHNQDCTAQTA